jgi:hypothetical protein
MNGDQRSRVESDINDVLEAVTEDLYYVANLLEKIQKRTLADESAAAAQLVVGIRKKLGPGGRR